jgi:hypothetical protein
MAMDYPSYSPDLKPRDFQLLRPFEKYLVFKRFAAATDVKQAAIFWLQTLCTDELLFERNQACKTRNYTIM